jgi:hydrogenase maturation protein HypF
VTAGALAIRVRGVVQGVGFRPFVHRLALRYGLAGEVRNASGAVEIDIEGPEDELDAFLSALTAEAPPLTQFDAIDVLAERPRGRTVFRIDVSVVEPPGRLPVSPDVAICASCERELADPADRRFGYPFITCTDCGPRYTVIEAMPYDRERTSMRVFAQCAACRAEYDDPASRRYHSQTNSCPSCGPALWLERGGETVRGADGSLPRAAELLARGEIVAIRGLGGFHLAVDATNAGAVARLRRRKRRDAKPLAVMVRTIADAEALAEVGETERAALECRARPIVLLRSRRARGSGYRSGARYHRRDVAVHAPPDPAAGAGGQTAGDDQWQPE